MPDISSNETLDLSVLDNPSFNIPEDSSSDNLPDNPQELIKKAKTPDEQLDLSVVDDLFPSKTSPINAPPAKITSKFGNRKDPFGAGVKFHNGVDIPMTLNTPVNSLGKGTVVSLGDSGNKDYGRYVEVDYGGGLVLTYGHLNKIAVQQGDRVSSEAMLGLSGSTGRSKGPHLHIRAKLNGKSVDPEDYFGNIHNIAIGALGSEDVVDENKLDLSILDTPDANFDWKDKLQKEVGNVGNPVEAGNLDPYHRKIYKYPNDQEYGTTYSMSFEDEDGSNVLIPQIVDGQMLTKEQAIEHYRKTGEHFGKFKTWQEADKYAEALHNSQDTYLRQTRPDLYEAQAASEEKLDLSPLDTIGDQSVKPIKEEPYKDRRTYEEVIGAGAASLNQPKITVANPNQLLGDRISTIIPVIGENKPDINTTTDSWLGAVDPSYAKINSEYRGLTGKNLVTFDGQPEYIGDNKYRLTARLTKGSVDLINAYIEGRNQGGPQAGWEAAYSKSQEIKRQEQGVKDEVDKFRSKDISDEINRHPYLAPFLFGVNTATGTDIKPEDVTSGISNLGMQVAQMTHNMRMLPEAIYKLERYGGDSQEYQDLIEKDREVQKNLFGYQSEISQPESISGKIVSGAITGAASLPIYAAAGNIGVEGLPLLVYLENLHRGNRQAAISALPMALMSGFSHGFGEYLNSGTKIYLNTEDEAGNPINKVVEVGRGLGNKAPFTAIREELSLDPKVQEAFLAKDPVSIASFSPLERQLILRGSNALLMGGATAAEGGDLRNIASSLVVGLTFPVGKYKAGTFDEGKLIENPPIDNPNSDYLHLPTSPEGVLKLDLDTAALRVLDLKRALTDKTFIGTGNVGVKASVSRQLAIQKAIGVLTSQIPPDVMKYFEENEGLIRSALKTNWEAVRAKEEYLGNQTKTEEITSPDEIKTNPSIEQTPIERLQNNLNTPNIETYEIYRQMEGRNDSSTVDSFNQARRDLVNRLSNDAIKNTKGIVFNSGLNPDALIDNIKLLYSGFENLGEFTNELVSRYGESIRQYAEDFYWAVRDKAAGFNAKMDISIDEWDSNLNKLKDRAAFEIRQFGKSEEGSLKLPRFLRKKGSEPELEDYYSDQTKHQVAIGLDYRAWMRGVALSQISTEFGKVYDTMRSAQRVVHAYESNILNQLMLAKKVIKAGIDGPVSDAIYDGNEKGITYTDAELTTRGLNAQQIQGYRNVRGAIDNVLNLRLEGKLYAVREKAEKLNAKFQTLTPGTPEYDLVANQLLDLQNAKMKMIDYYDKLKTSGYITLQRRGTVAAFIEDPNYPVGDPKRKIYNQFNSASEANDWINKQKVALGIPKTTLAGNIYDIKNLKDIALKEKLTPSQFEDLVDRSGANTNDPQIEKIRTEVYSKFPSFTYQLDREFVRGYDRDLQTAINSTVHQAELYSSSFYSKVGGEEGMKALEATGLESSDPNLYKIASKYIKDETGPGEMNWLSKKAIQARRFTYLWQLGFDFNQLYLNAVAQPITQTYGYFSRIEYDGKRLTGLEPEHYFKEGIKLAAKGGDPDFEAIKNQLTAEHVLAPEFTKSLIESQTGTGKVSKVEHWASVFMRLGEKATRTQAAAEAYLIGKEKFNLAGDDLIKFMVKAVDATQSNPTRGENPYAIRTLGEPGKLFYQFLAFNQMWIENLAIGIKQSEGISGKSTFAARELIPLAIMGGMTGMPLASFAGTLYTLITKKDPKKLADKYLGNDTFMEYLTRYGITTSATMSQKLTPSAPILDQAGRALTADFSAGLGGIADNIPVLATGDQLLRGISQVLTKGKRLKGLENLSSRAIKGPEKTIEALKYGFTSPAGKTLLPKGKETALQLAGQLINITPTPVVEKYDALRNKKLINNTKRFRKTLKANL